MKLSPLLFGPDSSVGIVNEEEELLVEDDLEEANSLGGGGGEGGQVVGYTGPLGAPGVGTSSALEKGFWPDDVGKEVKTGSPELDKDIKETIQAVGTPTKKLNMVKLLWSEDDVDDPVKTDSEALHKDI